MMQPRTDIVRYPLLVRYMPLALTVLGIVIAVVVVHQGVPRVPPLQDAREFFICAFNWLVMILFPIATIFTIWRTWFFLNSYRCTEESVEEISLLLRKHKCVKFADIVEVRAFTLSARYRDPSWSKGHALVSREGVELQATEALPIWAEIAEHVAGLPESPCPLLLRWIP